MVKARLCLLALLLMLLFLAACGEAVKANLGQEFSLAIGQTASIQSEQLKLKFLEVVNDSRCPSEVSCAWPGQASSLVEITYLESVQKVTLVQPDLTEELSRIDFNDYVIKFNLTPYPQARKEIKKSDYRLQVVITKPPLSSENAVLPK